MKTGDKVKKDDNLNKILRLEELSGTWNYKDLVRCDDGNMAIKTVTSITFRG